MAFLHCHKCGWEQDDFWSENYNPIKSLQDWMKDLLTKDLEEVFGTDEFTGYTVTWRELLAKECEKAAKAIRNMKWRTEKDYKESEDQTCPKCGSPLDVD